MLLLMVQSLGHQCLTPDTECTIWNQLLVLVSYWCLAPSCDCSLQGRNVQNTKLRWM